MEPEVIERLIHEFVESLPVTDEPYYREAAIRFMLKEFVWAVHERFPKEKHLIVEQLELMSEAVKESKD
jgi:hypothetical protein